jgi:hypothetical protein
MHFAQPDDMNIMVPAVGALTTDHITRNILGVDPSVGRIRNWDVDADREALEKQSVLIRLFNPRPFREADIQLEPEGAIVIEDDVEPAAETAPAKRRRPPTLAEFGRSSGASDYDSSKRSACALRTEALLMQMRMLLDSKV